jgi:outer membrane autotransporter protein
VIEMIDECGDAPGVLDLLSPESYAGLVDYGIQVTRNYTRTALMAPGASPIAPSAPEITEKGAKGGKAVIQPEITTRNTTVFAAFSHIDAGTDGDSSHDYDIKSNGGLVGARHTINALTFGGFVGYDQGDISSQFLDADVDGYVIGGFVSYLVNAQHNILVTGGVTYGNYDYDGDRDILGGSVDFETNSDVLDYYIQVQGDAYKNDRFRITPSLGVHYIDADVDGFSEDGSPLGLNVDSIADDALLAELDIKFEYAVTSNFLINGSVGYTHNFSGSERDIDADFQLSGTGFGVTAAGLGDDIFTAGIGAVWYINEAWSAGFGYRAEFSSDSDVTNAAGIGVSYSF